MILQLHLRRLCRAITAMVLFLGAGLTLAAQKTHTVQGIVIDAQKKPVEGSTVQVKQTDILTSTDKNGRFTLAVPEGKHVLVVSYVGKSTQEVTIGNQSSIVITLKDGSAEMDAVVVVGYGRQRKASVVGAITQTTGQTLERTGGVNNLGMALTGNLPGLVTTASSGMPGAEDPQILIRAQTSWNNSSPLILVDGIERPGALNTIDITSVESISILKDASATAVYGVKGANGVILITTKRGIEGKPTIRLRSNMTMKVASKLPQKYDAYDALSLRNTVVANELMNAPAGWTNIKPQDILNKYRNPANSDEWDRYPNVDWEKELFKSSTMSYNTSANVSGGSKFVTYFAAIDFVSEGDLFKNFTNNRGYDPGYGYTRTNIRSNLDFNLTPTTKFTTRLFGSNGVRKGPWGSLDGDASYWASAYRSAPDAMRPIYSDGTWGFYSPRNADVPNSVYNLAVSGIEKRTNTQITTDFVLQQDLSMFLKGLSARASLSLDNNFRESGRGINDLYNGPQRKWINPETGQVTLETPFNTGTQLDYIDQVRWSPTAGSVDKNYTNRHSNYQAQLNYSQRFGKSDVSGLALFQREKYATGGEFAHFREDWVFRGTYGYASKYLFEINGAYNGSEKFGPLKRFAFFPSFSAGWTISNEKFMKEVRFINLLKLRGSWGWVGDDAGGPRFAYSDVWAYGGNTQMGSPLSNTPYTFYRITQYGNPNISWETVEKHNLGVDFSVLRGKVAGSFDVFNDIRSDIIIGGSSRAIPTYFGATAPAANLGEVKGRGYEVELKLNQNFGKKVRAWANINISHATNKVIYRDDPELLADYLKSAGHALGQTTSYLNSGYLQSWDDLYGSTERSTNNRNKLAGDYNIVDYNGDGVIDTYDRVPYQYSGTPQNTYNTTVGVDWKGFSAFVQFYAVNNVTREVTFPTFNTYSGSNVAYVQGSYWTKANGGGDVPLPRYSSLAATGAEGTRYLFDGSYVRLKNAEIGYTISGRSISRIGLKSLRLYVNGNNLALWTDMPDDRESNFSGGSSFGAYPTMKRYNAGIDINL